MSRIFCWTMVEEVLFHLLFQDQGEIFRDRTYFAFLLPKYLAVISDFSRIFGRCANIWEAWAMSHAFFQVSASKDFCNYHYSLGGSPLCNGDCQAVSLVGSICSVLSFLLCPYTISFILTRALFIQVLIIKPTGGICLELRLLCFSLHASHIYIRNFLFSFTFVHCLSCKYYLVSRIFPLTSIPHSSMFWIFYCLQIPNMAVMQMNDFRI